MPTKYKRFAPIADRSILVTLTFNNNLRSVGYMCSKQQLLYTFLHARQWALRYVHAFLLAKGSSKNKFLRRPFLKSFSSSDSRPGALSHAISDVGCIIQIVNSTVDEWMGINLCCMYVMYLHALHN